jgi:aminoglycoside 2''-phosphotransferase
VTIISLRYMGGGDYSVYSVNNELVFRFPKIASDDADDNYQREVALFDALRPHVAPHQIPTLLKHLPPGDHFDKPVSVYACLDGTQAAQMALNPAQKQQVAVLLGDFLSKLHAIDPAALGMESPASAPMTQQWIKQFTEIRQQVYPLLNDDEQRWFTRLYESILADADQMRPPIALTHGDFGPENVLVPDHLDYLQVVDFEDIGAGDPVGDFCIWWGEWGADFLDTMLRHYTGPVDPHFRQRIVFYYDRIPALYLNWSIRSGNPKFEQFGRALLHQRMNRRG